MRAVVIAARSGPGNGSPLSGVVGPWRGGAQPQNETGLAE